MHTWIALTANCLKFLRNLIGYQEIQSLSDSKYNAAIDQLTKAADEWNEAVRGYKAQ